jgi:cysteinyl-tRNA synthetase
MLRVIGLKNLLEPEQEEVPDQVRRLVEEREAARESGDYATADAKRAESASHGWIVRDTPEGPRIERAR